MDQLGRGRRGVRWRDRPSRRAAPSARCSAASRAIAQPLMPPPTMRRSYASMLRCYVMPLDADSPACRASRWTASDFARSSPSSEVRMTAYAYLDHAKHTRPACPRAQQILDFIATSDAPAGKREIARAFGLHGAGQDRAQGAAQGHGRRGADRQRPRPRLPQDGRRAQGDGAARSSMSTTATASGRCPSAGRPRRPPPRLRVRERGKRGALGVGDRILARTEEAGQRLDRASDEEARARRGADARRAARGGRPAVAASRVEKKRAARLSGVRRGRCASRATWCWPRRPGGRRGSPRG